MNGWNLGGNFPVDQLARFRALSEIDISNNPSMRADLKKMFDSFAQLQNLQVHLVMLPGPPPVNYCQRPVQNATCWRPCSALNSLGRHGSVCFSCMCMSYTYMTR